MKETAGTDRVILGLNGPHNTEDNMNDKYTWMKKLADHYRRTTDRFLHEKHMIVFDIDGTILDSRYMVRYTLQSFDSHHGTDFFKEMKIADITQHETEINDILAACRIPEDWKPQIIAWYVKHCWSVEAVMKAHRPFIGVMEVIRWFQIQPNTYVGFNSGRSESIRHETICCLNKIGHRFKVSFENDLVYLNRSGRDNDIMASKAEGMAYFRKAGYRIFAFVDNEPENLEVVSSLDRQQQIMLLHADTIFRSQRHRMPLRAVSGARYDIVDLFDEKSLPGHIQFVWHSIVGLENLKQFLSSNVQWAEFPIRLDSSGRNLVIGGSSYDEDIVDDGEDTLHLQNLIPILAARQKSIKIDLKEEGWPVDKLIDLLEHCAFDDSRLWLSGKIEILRESGFRRLAACYPRAILQCPVDYLVPLILSMPSAALSILNTFRDWGINRVSLSWKTPFLETVLEKLERWGFDVNIYHVPDLESFLKTVLMLPRSITSDFNFTSWSQGQMSTAAWPTPARFAPSGPLLQPVA